MILEEVLLREAFSINSGLKSSQVAFQILSIEMRYITISKLKIKLMASKNSRELILTIKITI